MSLAPEADKPRLVADYTGLQILDCRETIRVRLKDIPPRGIRCGLKVEGFKQRPDGDWEAPHTPHNIFAAQVIANEYFPTRP